MEIFLDRFVQLT